METLKRFALMAGSVLIGFLLLELGIRRIEPREVIREYFERPDAVLHHRFIPGARGRHKTPEFDAVYVINSLGLRGEEVPRAKPPGTSRILMLGDSFTEGNGVDANDTFSSRLQELLNKRGEGTRWQVINAGVGSYSPLLQYIYLKDQGLALQPDLVILNFDLSDIYDDIQYTRLAEFDAKGDPVAVRAEPEGEAGPWPLRMLVSVKDLLKQHTRTYNFVRRRIGRYVDAARHKRNFSGDVRFDKYAMLREAGEAQGDRAWGLTYRYLLLIRDLLKTHGIDFRLTVYPYGLQLSPREWARGRGFWGFETGKVYPMRAQALVERFCRDNHILVINMCQEFQDRSQTIYPLYYDVDGHWRPAGHQLVADILHGALLPYLQMREARAGADAADALPLDRDRPSE